MGPSGAVVRGLGQVARRVLTRAKIIETPLVGLYIAQTFRYLGDIASYMNMYICKNICV